MSDAYSPSSVDVEALRARVAELMPATTRDLQDLVRVPSVSAAAFDAAHLEASAELVAGLLRGAGMPEVEILRVQGPPAGAPAVIARRPAPEGAPTVLLYAHHDVQPPGEDGAWHSPPFEPTERQGRLFGRGAADDKAGVMVHVTALRALADQLGVGVSVFVEGEEEVGSPTFATFLAEQRERLAADVIVVADSSNWKVGVPALTTSLRGLVDCVVEVATLDHAVHSGLFGGVAPDAMTAMVRLLGTLWEESGRVAVPGLVTGSTDVDYDEADFRADAGVLDGVQLLGSGSVASRLWRQPSITVVGLDAPSIERSSNTLQPRVRAKLSMRLAPGQDPATALRALREHLGAQAPFGARVEVEPGELGQPFAADVDGPVYDVARWAMAAAWGVPPVPMGMGGSIPFIADLIQTYPSATVLVTGVEDPDSRAHGADESLHLAEFERACLAETLLLAGLARSAG